MGNRKEEEFENYLSGQFDNYLEQSDFFKSSVEHIVESIKKENKEVKEEMKKENEEIKKENEEMKKRMDAVENNFKIPFNGNDVQFAELIDVLQKMGWITINKGQLKKSVNTLKNAFEIEANNIYEMLKDSRREKEIYNDGIKEKLFFQEIKKNPIENKEK